MPFRIEKKDGSARDAIQRITRELATDSLRLLKSDDTDLDVAVHEARKTVKKLRAMLRVVHPDCRKLGEARRLLRQAAVALAPLRDAKVLLATFDEISGETDADADLIAALRAPFAAALAAARSPEKLSAAVSAYGTPMRKLRGESDRWKPRHKGFSAFAPGIERTWTAAKDALIAARSGQDEEAIHLLRKRVKDHWYQARLLAQIAPAEMAPRIAASGDLGELLGRVHDLDLLIAEISAMPDAAPLRKAATEERDRLAAQALPDAEAFLAEPAEALLGRWRAAWKAWRA